MCRCRPCRTAMTSEASPYDELDALVEDAFDDVETALADETGWGDSMAESALRPPGNCSRSRHDELQRRVDQACGGPGVFPRLRSSCDNRLGCGVLRSYGLRNVRCAQARNAINQECYDGGDAGHRQAARTAAAAAHKCRLVFRRRRCRGTRFFD